MPNVIKSECPKCGKKGKNYEQIEDKFGWRIIKGKKRPQSYCRECRRRF
ncbi:hypothetical protein HYT53_01985 [Candidatus Woesearchaeota archaeon]|nr:hypothetical protein [Candidatus Woesearchaeota archaeon]MBI4156836.1 hypothetical protein [Candidatus Woesearchaeota archaeon]